MQAWLRPAGSPRGIRACQIDQPTTFQVEQTVGNHKQRVDSMLSIIVKAFSMSATLRALRIRHSTASTLSFARDNVRVSEGALA